VRAAQLEIDDYAANLDLTANVEIRGDRMMRVCRDYDASQRHKADSLEQPSRHRLTLSQFWLRAGQMAGPGCWHLNAVSGCMSVCLPWQTDHHRVSHRGTLQVLSRVSFSQARPCGL